MTSPLRSEVLVPARAHTWHTLLLALGCGAIGAAFGVGAHSEPRPRVAVVPAPPLPPVQAPAIAPAPVVEPAPAAQPVRSSEVSLVFSADAATYMKLADIGEDAVAMPKHGPAKLISGDVETVIARIAPADVPEAYRRWQGRKVVVDGACETEVTGFAVVSRLTGDTGYAGIDDAKWTAKNVLEHGSVVLAARLAGCQGTLARDASLPPVIVPEEIDNPELAKRARVALIASQPSRDTQREYLEFDHQGNWWDDEYTSFTTHVVKHPTTGVTWVSVHGSIEHACGDGEVNVWGLFRVEPDGTLAAVQLRKLGDLWSIDQLVDLDNDGELELVGKPWLGLDTVITRASGEELDRLALPFFGCPC
ncbi:MAG TPA: hypothetical protein VFS15_29475 [Kofleriaceae bacterium]|nr:hypothetical protein [Kofleriaceae bacterium]